MKKCHSLRSESHSILTIECNSLLNEWNLVWFTPKEVFIDVITQEVTSVKRVHVRRFRYWNKLSLIVVHVARRSLQCITRGTTPIQATGVRETTSLFNYCMLEGSGYIITGARWWPLKCLYCKKIPAVNYGWDHSYSGYWGERAI